MKKLLAIIALILWSGASLANQEPQQLALVIGGLSVYSGGPAVCPFAKDNGCSGANFASSWWQPNFLQPGGYANTFAHTSANYMATTCGAGHNVLCRPDKNMPGIEYPVGYYSQHCTTSTTTPGTWVPGACLIDPQAHPPVGCTIASNGISGSTDKQMTCNQAGFLGIIKHYDFGDVNSHDCTGLYIPNAGPATAALIEDNRFFNNSGMCATNFVNNNYAFYITGFTGMSVIQYNTFDFNNAQWSTISGPCVLPTRCNGWNIGFGTLPLTVQYNAFLNNPNDWFGGNRNSPTGTLVQTLYKYNVIAGWCSRVATCHKEMYAAGNPNVALLTDPTNTMDDFEMIGNTVINGSQQTTNFGPTWLFMSNGAMLAYTHGPVLKDNMIIQAYVGNRPIGGVTYSACVGQSWDSVGHTCVWGTVNLTMFVTAETGPIGTSSGCGDSGTYQLIPGPYPDPAIKEEYTIDGPTAGGATANRYYPSGWNGPASPTSCVNQVNGPQEITNGAIFDSHGVSPYGSVDLEGNFFDISSYANGSSTPTLYNFTDSPDIPSNPVPVASGSISGTTLTTSTSLTLRAGLYLYAANIPGCATNLQSCPRILINATGTSFTLDTNVGTIAAEPMNAYSFTWCNVAPVTGDNHDMTGAIADSWFNGITTVQNTAPLISGCFVAPH